MATIQPRMKVGFVAQDLKGNQKRFGGWYLGSGWLAAWPATAIDDCLTDAIAQAAPAGAVGALTDAGLVEVLASETRGFGGAVMTVDPAQPYGTSDHKLELRILRGDGGTSTPEIPAPKASLFQADGRTFNPADASMAQLIAALTQPGVCDVSGNEYQLVRGGTRTGRGWRGVNPGGQP